MTLFHNTRNVFSTYLAHRFSTKSFAIDLMVNFSSSEAILFLRLLNSMLPIVVLYYFTNSGFIQITGSLKVLYVGVSKGTITLDVL